MDGALEAGELAGAEREVAAGAEAADGDFGCVDGQRGVGEEGVGDGGDVVDGGGEGVERGFAVAEARYEHAGALGPGYAEFVVELRVAGGEAAAVDVYVEGQCCPGLVVRGEE